MKKTLISTAVAAVLGATSFNTNAISNSDIMTIDAGGSVVSGCLLGTVPPCIDPAFDLRSQTGSYFTLANTTINITGNEGIILGTTQLASGSHSGSPDGTESPGIDTPVFFTSGTLMHQSTSPITVISNTQLNMAGWSITWLGIDDIPMGGCFLVPDGCGGATDTGIADIVITGDTYVLDYFATTPNNHSSNIGGANYFLHLEGTIVSAVPVPAAVWLFGSGLIGLTGVARQMSVLC